jgi:hypothetical protein
VRDPLATHPVGLGGRGVPRVAPAIPVAAAVRRVEADRAGGRDLPRRVPASPVRAVGPRRVPANLVRAVGPRRAVGIRSLVGSRVRRRRVPQVRHPPRAARVRARRRAVRGHPQAPVLGRPRVLAGPRRLLIVRPPRARGRPQARPGHPLGPPDPRRAVRPGAVRGHPAPARLRVGQARAVGRADRPSGFGPHARTGHRRRGAGTLIAVPTGRARRGRAALAPPRIALAAIGPRRALGRAGPRPERVPVGRPRVTAPAAPPGTPEPVVPPAAAVAIARPGPAVSVTRAVRGPSRGRFPVTQGSGTLSFPRASTSPSWIA